MLKKILCFIIIASLAYAEGDDITAIYCPKAYKLTKNELTWSGSSNYVDWKSTEPSLSEDAATFVGAQWDGIRVGAISCVYQSADELSFPIVLKNEHLFKQPEHPNWKADNDGAYTCHSDDTEDCPLSPSMEQQTESDLHKIMKQIKP